VGVLKIVLQCAEPAKEDLMPSNLFLLNDLGVIGGWVVLFEEGSIGEPMSKGDNENVHQVGSSWDAFELLPNYGS
jgi:hypothetical protein